MSDQQYDPSGVIPLYYPDQVVLIIPRDVFESMAEKFTALVIEAMARPVRSGGGGNWGGKRPEGTDHGLFRLPPTDLKPFDLKTGDTLKTPVSGYYFKKSDRYPSKVVFLSPFDGAPAASITPGSKTWDKIFIKDGKAWEYDDSGQRHGFNLRIATLCVGENKDDGNKFLYLVSLKPSEILDAEALDYTATLPLKKENTP